MDPPDQAFDRQHVSEINGQCSLAQANCRNRNKIRLRLCAPLVVSRRADDTLTIIDGQYRWMAVCRRSDIPQLPCCVFRYANIEEEARMFIIANRARKPINRLDDYFAALAATAEDALEIRDLVSRPASGSRGVQLLCHGNLAKLRSHHPSRLRSVGLERRSFWPHSQTWPKRFQSKS